MLFNRCFSFLRQQEYPIGQISCPMAIFYGGIDYLTDIPWLLRVVPKETQVFSIPDYEHLDTMWASTAPALASPLFILLFAF